MKSERIQGGESSYATAFPPEVQRVIDMGESPDKIRGFYGDKRGFLDDIESLIEATEE